MTREEFEKLSDDEMTAVLLGMIDALGLISHEAAADDPTGNAGRC
jgi:hypothetical protein